MDSNHWTHVDIPYLAKAAHWHTPSQPYTGADHLLSALARGWQLHHEVRRIAVPLPSGWSVVIYRFQLQRGGEAMTMPVIHTPCLDRIVTSQQLRIV